MSSALLAVEAVRACARYGSERAAEARSWLIGLALLPLDDEVLDVATKLEPVGLRSLDALHLATAMTVRDDIGALLAYDERLIAAAHELDLPVVQPV